LKNLAPVFIERENRINNTLKPVVLANLNEFKEPVERKFSPLRTSPTKKTVPLNGTGEG